MSATVVKFRGSNVSRFNHVIELRREITAREVEIAQLDLELQETRVELEYYKRRWQQDIGKCPRLDLITRIVSDYFGISYKDIVSDQRGRHIVNARWAAMFLCREFSDASYPTIGFFFGGKDHSTVIHAVKKMEGEILRDVSKRAAIHWLRKLIKAETHNVA